MTDTCPKGCKDRHGRPVQLKGGKVYYDRKQKKRMIRKHCPKCFEKVSVPEKEKI